MCRTHEMVSELFCYLHQFLPGCQRKKHKKPSPNIWNAAVVISLLSLQYSPVLQSHQSRITPEVLFLTLVISQNCIGFKGSSWNGAFGTWESLQSIPHICYWLSARESAEVNSAGEYLLNISCSEGGSHIPFLPLWCLQHHICKPSHCIKDLLQL